MMNRVMAGLLAIGMLTLPALAAAPTAEQKAEFYAVCMARSSNQELCTCKRDATTELIDSGFMEVVIASMKGKTLAAEFAVPYNDYIANSTRACGMGM